MIKHRLLLLGVLISYTAQSSAHEELIEAGSTIFWMYVIISFSLSCFAGLCSGLTVGYMAINKNQMELWSKSDNQEQRKMSKPILEVLENHHQLLSTLLLANALSLQALPIFLDRIVPGYMAIIISTCAVVVFGEVLPQAYCTGHMKVKIGYYLSGFVKVLEFVLYIFVKPIVYILDHWIGHHDEDIILNKENLKAILYLHNSRDYGYRPEQIEILQNTIDLRSKIVKNHMIKLEQAFSISEDDIVNENLINQISEVNFSKIPVYSGEKSNIIGYIKVKSLLCFNLSQPKKIKQGGDGNVIAQIVKIKENNSLLQAIEIFKSNKTNFAVVIEKQTHKSIGVITLKQVFEKLVLKEFKDNDFRVNLKFGQNQKNLLDEVVEGKEQD